jgi:hypothetical protein
MVAPLLGLASALAFVGVGAAVGGRLLWLASRTRALPEALVGGALAILAGVAWPLLLLVSLGAALPEGVLRGAWAVASLAMGLGWSSVGLFTWRVFRPGSRWALAFTLLAFAVVFGAGLAGARRAYAVADLAALTAPNAGGLVLVLGAMALYAWSAVESLRYRALLVRRIPLGLADPLVADRFRLWAMISLLAIGSLVPGVASHFERAPDPTVVRLVVGVLGLASSTALYFAFLPPAGYARWVRARAPQPEPAGGF